MPFIKPPKFKIKNLLLLVVLLAVSVLISVVGKLMSNKTQPPIAQAQSCWTPPPVGGESCDSQCAGTEAAEGSAGSSGSAGSGESAGW